MDSKKYGFIELVTVVGDDPITFLFDDIEEYRKAFVEVENHGFEIINFYWGLDTYTAARFTSVADFYARKKTKESNVVHISDWQPQDEGC